MARLSLVDETLKEEMKKEVSEVLKASSYKLKEEALDKMKLLQCFILEVGSFLNIVV